MTNQREHTFGRVVPWDSAPEPGLYEVDPRHPAHWPLWFARKDPWQKVSDPTISDLEFVITGFGEALQKRSPEAFEEDRYIRFCLTFDGYAWAIAQGQLHNIDNPHEAIQYFTTRVLLIGGMSTTQGGPLDADAEERFANFCSVEELRTAMFHRQRSHYKSGGHEDFLSEYPELRQFARAIAAKLRRSADFDER